VDTRTDVTRQFDPGATTAGGFPSIQGWIGDDAGEEGSEGGAGDTGAADTGATETGQVETGR
jgi:hypothetical protein